MAILIGLGSVVLWPGDPEGEPLSVSHWASIAGFAVAASLLVVAAVSLLLAVVGATWGSSKFDPNEFLEESKRD